MRMELRMRPLVRRVGLLAALCLCAGALILGSYALWFRDQHGAPDPRSYDDPTARASAVSYARQVKPLLEKRCVVCHACYDAPCQLKLGSFPGIARGLSAQRVYDGERLVEAPPTRLFVDAQKPSQWRQKGFSPVLNEYRDTPGENRALSLIARVLALKQAQPQPASGHPFPAGGLVSETLDFSIDRAQSCPKIETFELYEKTHPLAGMPFGLPAVAPAERDLILTWLEQGAPNDELAALSERDRTEIAAWEQFLNGETAKERLMSRYLYEHLFLAHLYFDETLSGQAFKLVRSSTPPGQPIAVIATRRPFDDPGARVFYRLQREQEPIVAKTHMPYRFDAAKRARLRDLFLAPDYAVDRLPSYAPKLASNGLASFAALPEDSRYRFLLDDAQYFIMTFIKGPVCRGQVALDVIEDRFWVFFFDPVAGVQRDAADVARRALQSMPLPAADGSDSPPLPAAWTGYASREREYQSARALALRAFAAAHGGPALGMIWDGRDDKAAGANPAAALTVMRHLDSATVVRGLVGAPPKTAWLLDYSLFERIYYLLAAGYDPYGNVTHHLYSRLYMDFLRMEGEANFIGFLPSVARKNVLTSWYRDATPDSLAQMRALALDPGVETAIRFHGADPKAEFFMLLEGRLDRVLDRRLSLDSIEAPELRAKIAALAGLRGAALGLLPELSALAVADARGAERFFTLVKDTGHRNVTHLLLERDELAPEDNALTIVPGLIGAYPNAFFRLKETDLPDFASAIAALASEDDYRRLGDRFALRRTDADFWAFSDRLQAAEARRDQSDRGLLDYSRLENR